VRTSRTSRLIGFSFVVAVRFAASAQEQPVEAWVPEALSAWRPGLEMIYAGREDAGFEWILERHRQRPEDPCGYYFAAQGYLNYDLGSPDWEERNTLGRELLDQGLELDDSDAASRFCKGAMYGVRAERRVAEGGYLGAAFDGKKMRRVMLDLLEEQPAFVDCQFYLGVYDYYAAVLPKYIKFFRTLLFLPSGDRDRGIAELDEATRRGVLEKYNAHWVLSGVYDEQEQPDKKRELLQRFHEAYPDDVDTARSLAENLALVEPQELERGVEVLQEFIQRLEGTGSQGNPQRVDLLYALGRVFARSYDYERARPELREALTLGRDDEQRALRVGELLISTLNVSGRHAEAVEIFHDLEQRYPEAGRLESLKREAFEYDEASSRLALLIVPAQRLVWEGKIEDAEAKYKELLREHDGAAQIHLFMAEMYFDEKQWPRSEARFNKVAELAPETPTFMVSFTQIRLGQICDLTDRRKDAKKHYRVARDTAGLYKNYARAAEYFLKNRYTGG
jgi:tetratricopeptide (TPR) repeat protein